MSVPTSNQSNNFPNGLTVVPDGAQGPTFAVDRNGNLTISGTLVAATIQGTTEQATNLTLTGFLSVGTTLTVAGTSSLVGAVTFGSAIAAAQITSLNVATLTATGAVNLQGVTTINSLNIASVIPGATVTGSGTSQVVTLPGGISLASATPITFSTGTNSATINSSGSTVFNSSAITASNEFYEFHPTVNFTLTGNVYGLRIFHNIDSTGGANFGGGALLGDTKVMSDNAQTVGTRQAGVRGGTQHDGTGNYDDLRALDASATLTRSGSSSSLAGVYSYVSVGATSAGSVVADARAMYVNQVANTGLGSVTRATGLEIEAITGGTTNRAIKTNGSTVSSFGGRILAGTNTDSANGLIQIPSSSSSTGLALGIRAAENIYRISNDSLKTDSAWTVAGTTTVGDDILPATTGQPDLGKTGSRFRNGWFNGTLLTVGATTLGPVTATTKIVSYNGTTTAGFGVPVISAFGFSSAVTSAQSSIATFTVGAADGLLDIHTNVNVTTSTAHSFGVVVTYTDETNTLRSLTVPMAQLAGTTVAAITNVTGAGPYEGVKLTIRAKAATAITITTSGTFTTVTYNVYGSISQIQ